jgi:aspartate/methionine/tyrosine aminotransferase
VAVETVRSRGRGLLDLTESNPTRADLVDLVPLIAELGHPRGAEYEPEPLGHPRARQAVAQYYAGRGLYADPKRIVLSASTSEAYAWIFSLLADPDDAILVPRPSYPLLSWIGASQRVRLLPYPLARDAGFRIDFDGLRRALDDRTRAVVLVHPNNPTGSFVRKDEATELCSIARERDLALVVDEVFADHVLDALPSDALASFTELSPEKAPLVFVLSGLSKVLLLPQCKLGWTVVSGHSALVREAIARLELIADTYLSVATPIQLALPSLLTHQPAVARAVRDRLRRNLATLDAALSALGPAAPVRRLSVSAGWYAILEIPRIRDEDGWVELLIREEGVLVHPGYFFDFDRDGFLVLSLLPKVDLFREGVRRLVARLASP